MDKRADSGCQAILPADFTAAMDWWREAGVDCAFADAPRQWVVAPARQAAIVPDDADSFPALKAAPPPPPVAPRAVIGGDRGTWPGNLAAFGEWWLSEPSLDAGQVRRRIPPRGPERASLLVLVPEPEAADSDMLLSGPQGRLLAAMLSAMGIDPGQVYFASALPRHTPGADWTDLAAQGLGDMLRHHLDLVRPQRVIAFGRHISTLLGAARLASPLVGNAPTQTTAALLQIGHDGGNVPLLVARDLGSLLERPIAKGAFWQQWLGWSAAE